MPVFAPRSPPSRPHSARPVSEPAARALLANLVSRVAGTRGAYSGLRGGRAQPVEMAAAVQPGEQHQARQAGEGADGEEPRPAR